MTQPLQAQRDPQREKWGWYQLVAISLLMPLLFFICVYFPIWMGWTPRFP
jgi:hypothetical protein